jgi:glycosyltransferase involved in cell wall biosynthesis
MSRVVAVFAPSRDDAARALEYLRRQIPGVPLRLYQDRWGVPRWPALMVVAWTGGRGRWLYKAAPFLIPPFRVLVMNEHGDFFAATPAGIARHLFRRLHDALNSAWNRARDINRGLWLWLFALLAQRFAFLSRWAFRKRHGAGPLEIQCEPGPASGGIVRFRYAHRQWNRAELLRLLKTTDARWVLFLEGDADDQPPWVDDPRTFAVSRQRDYQDWKQGLFPMAPFRQLQPDEISQVLAPVSDAVLVDRAKLLALGIPQTIVPGTAWLILFWKAAAAGWRSYSAGGARKLDASPDWPYEEAEFVTRVLADPGLRKLGPREPDLARGSIARSLRASACSKPVVLVVSPYLPYPLSHGGAVRIYNLCRALSPHVDFLLACFREQTDSTNYARLGEVFRGVWVVDRDEKPIRDASLPRQVREHQSRSLRALIAEVCRERKVNLLQVEFTHMAHFRDAAPEVPAILVEHDLTFTLYRQFADQEARREARLEYERWLAFERHWLRGYDAVWTMSDEDREQAIEQGSPEAFTFTVANGVDIQRYQPCEERTPAPEIFYMGSFRHRPNVIGFERLLKEIMPRVWKRFPNARLRVVAGPEPARYWKGKTDRRVRMHGFVEDPRPMYAKASVVVVPLLVSAGTNIKVMEAMACQKAVVSTPVGCQGLGLRDGRDALIRAESRPFADAICDLLYEDKWRARIAAQARRTVEERFSWTRIAESARRSYDALL